MNSEKAEELRRKLERTKTQSTLSNRQQPKAENQLENGNKNENQADKNMLENAEISGSISLSKIQNDNIQTEISNLPDNLSDIEQKDGKKIKIKEKKSGSNNSVKFNDESGSENYKDIVNETDNKKLKDDSFYRSKFENYINSATTISDDKNPLGNDTWVTLTIFYNIFFKLCIALNFIKNIILKKLNDIVTSIDKMKKTLVDILEYSKKINAILEEIKKLDDKMNFINKYMSDSENDGKNMNNMFKDTLDYFKNREIRMNEYFENLKKEVKTLQEENSKFKNDYKNNGSLGVPHKEKISKDDLIKKLIGEF